MCALQGTLASYGLMSPKYYYMTLVFCFIIFKALSHPLLHLTLPVILSLVGFIICI